MLPNCYAAIVFVISVLLSGCAGHDVAKTSPQEQFKLERLFPVDNSPSVTFDAQISASPLLYSTQGKTRILVSVSNGIVAALDSETGALDWQVHAPVPNGQQAQLISTPVMIGDKLVILYQSLEKGKRTSHRLAVIDLAKKQVDEAFPVLVLSAEKPTADGNGNSKIQPAYRLFTFSIETRGHTGFKPGFRLCFIRQCRR